MSHHHSGPDQRRATGNDPAAILAALDAMARAADLAPERSPASAAGARMGAWLRARFGPADLCAPLTATAVAGRIAADMARIDAVLTLQLNADPAGGARAGAARPSRHDLAAAARADA